MVVALPIFNEQLVLSASVEKLHTFLSTRFSAHTWQIVIADNGSTDASGVIGRGLADRFAHVSYAYLPTPGKGGAIRTVWQNNPADISAFMDIDLATDLAAFPVLVAAIGAGADVAIGSRFVKGSCVERSWQRRVFSYGFHVLLKMLFWTKISDTPCGFKAVSARVVREVVPQVEDNSWFFDTELVLRAERAGMKICEIPIAWREHETKGRRSKVSLGSVISDYVGKSLRLFWNFFKTT